MAEIKGVSAFGVGRLPSIDIILKRVVALHPGKYSSSGEVNNASSISAKAVIRRSV